MHERPALTVLVVRVSPYRPPADWAINSLLPQRLRLRHRSNVLSHCGLSSTLCSVRAVGTCYWLAVWGKGVWLVWQVKALLLYLNIVSHIFILRVRVGGMTKNSMVWKNIFRGNSFPHYQYDFAVRSVINSSLERNIFFIQQGHFKLIKSGSKDIYDSK